MKKFLSILLTVVLVLSTFTVGFAGAVDMKVNETTLKTKSKGIITLSAAPADEQYAWGDEVVFNVDVTNNTGTDYENVKVRAQANKAKFFYDGESNTVAVGSIKAGETQTIQISVKSSTPGILQRLIVLPIYYILDFFSPMAFRDYNFDATTLVRVGVFRYRFGFDVTDGKIAQSDTQNHETFYTASFNTNGGSFINSQTVFKGNTVVEPSQPQRNGYRFIAWYTEPECLNQFDFDEPITKSITLYAKWMVSDVTADRDNDNVTDFFEDFFGSDPTKDDSDGDGLSDYHEIYMTATEPALYDTDGNGISDADEDADGDGLTNLEEVQLGTDPLVVDSDGDRLSDYDEVRKYNTDPLVRDTDSDNVTDEKEVEIGTDPLVAQTEFTVTAEADTEDAVKASVNITLSGDQVESLSVEPTAYESLFPETIPGYIGQAYDFSVDGEFGEATISFEFDASLLNDEDFDPVIYYFNEEEQQLEELETTISGNVASAVVKHFSTYILINRKVNAAAFEWVDTFSTESNYSGVEIVFVIDDSGSMTSNDRNNERLNVAKNLIDRLPENSKIGIVNFESDIEVLTNELLTNKEEAKSFLTTSYFRSSGGTYMYRGIQSAFALFKTTGENTLRIIVDLSDGATSDTSMHSSTVNTANSKGIRIYTVGLGNSTSYFNSYLKPLANSTNGQFYLASNASQLSLIYEDIGDEIDLKADSDHDGIPDYYEDNLVLFNGVKIALDKYNADTDGDGLKDNKEIELKIEPNADGTKVKVTGKMLSDPTLPDTDFDGIKDIDDENKLSYVFFGKMAGNLYTVDNAFYRMNFREFFSDNNTYNSSIASASLIFSNTVYHHAFEYSMGASENVYNIRDLLMLHGFKDVEDYELDKVYNADQDRVYNDDDISEVGLGYQEVTYNGVTKTIVPVVIRGTNASVEEWSSNFDMGNPNAGWNEQYHKGFYITAERILDHVNKFVQHHSLNKSNVVFWVTGHSRGAALANICAAKLIDDGNTVFAYTYATPSTTTLSTKKESKYNSIYNYVNTSDFVTYVPLSQWDFGLFGNTIECSIENQYLGAVWKSTTNQSEYNALNRSLILLLTDRIARDCAPTWSSLFDLAGSQNISDEQYSYVSERAKKYCRIEERTGRNGKHKGYKLYPSAAFIFQIGAEFLSLESLSPEKQAEVKKGLGSLLLELLNSKYTPTILIFGCEVLGIIQYLPDVWSEIKPKNLNMKSLFGDGHATETYYVLMNDHA